MTTYLRDKRPLHVSDFKPPRDSDMYLDTLEEHLRYARGVLCERLWRLVWYACTDERPTSSATLELVHMLTQPAWREDPARAVAELKALHDTYWARVADNKARHPQVPDNVFEPHGVDARIGDALELFSKYAVAIGVRVPWNDVAAHAADFSEEVARVALS